MASHAVEPDSGWIQSFEERLESCPGCELQPHWASSEPHSGSSYSVGFLMAEWLGFKSRYPKKNMGKIHEGKKAQLVKCLLR